MSWCWEQVGFVGWTKPILSDNFGYRGQVDLIDMRTNSGGEYNWILNYQDHFTKWVVLRPLIMVKHSLIVVLLVRAGPD